MVEGRVALAVWFNHDFCTGRFEQFGCRVIGTAPVMLRGSAF